MVNTPARRWGSPLRRSRALPAWPFRTASVDRVVDEILARGRVAHGYLGVGLQRVELPDHQKGLIVLSLEPEGPAARAGLLIGDILVSLGGVPWRRRTISRACSRPRRGAAASRPPWCAEGPRRR